jgi:hypothetical protein
MRLTPVCLLLPLAALFASGVAEAKVLDIEEAVASSTYPGSDGVSYKPKNAVDGKVSTVWTEGADGAGMGESIKLTLKGGDQLVTGFTIWNGNWYTQDFFERHNRIKEILVEFADGTNERHQLEDGFKPQTVRLEKPTKTSSLTLKIKGKFGGSTFDDTCISEVQVFNDAPEVTVAAKSFTTSSTYPEDNDGNYEPANLQDRILDSMWCEGSKDGDGKGEWIEFDFGGSKKVSKLQINNGNSHSFAMFMKANSATSGTLTFSDGSSEKITIKPTMLSQTIAFDSRTTSKVKLTIDAVRAGKEFNDLCLSEAKFSE